MPKGSLPSSPQAGLVISVKSSQPLISQLRTKMGRTVIVKYEPGTMIHVHEKVIIKPLFCKRQDFKKFINFLESKTVSALNAKKAEDWKAEFR